MFWNMMHTKIGVYSLPPKKIEKKKERELKKNAMQSLYTDNGTACPQICTNLIDLKLVLCNLFTKPI